MRPTHQILAHETRDPPICGCVSALVSDTDSTHRPCVAAHQIMLLAAALVIGHVLTKQRVAWLGEAGAALLLGLGTGIICTFASVSETYLSWIAFKKEVGTRLSACGRSELRKQWFKAVGMLGRL